MSGWISLCLTSRGEPAHKHIVAKMPARLDSRLMAGDYLGGIRGPLVNAALPGCSGLTTLNSNPNFLALHTVALANVPRGTL